MTAIGARAVKAALALQPLGLTLIAGRDGFLVTDKPDDPSETALVFETIEQVEDYIADRRRFAAAAAQPAAPLKPLRYPPGATAVFDPEAGAYRAGSDVLTPAELRDRGFARTSNISFDSDWVQADGFEVRGLFRRGDAQRFTGAELLGLVTAFFAERGVEIEKPDALEAFCFNYEPSIDLSAAREQAAADIAAAAPLRPIEQRKPSVGDPVHYVSHGSPVREDGTQAYKSRCRAAIVTEVSREHTSSDGVLMPNASLCVLNPTGQYFDQGTRYDGGTFAGPEREASAGQPLPLITCADLTFEGGTWHYGGDR